MSETQLDAVRGVVNAEAKRRAHDEDRRFRAGIDELVRSVYAHNHVPELPRIDESRFMTHVWAELERTFEERVQYNRIQIMRGLSEVVGRVEVNDILDFANSRKG